MSAIVAETLKVAGFVTVAVTVAGDERMVTRLSGAVPDVSGRDVEAEIATALDKTTLPPVVVLTHPDVILSEVLHARGHDVVVTVGPRGLGGPDIEEVRQAHPASVTTTDVWSAFSGLTVYNSGLLTVGVTTMTGFAAPRLAAFCVDRLGARFPRRYAMSIAHMRRVPLGWVAVPLARAGHRLYATDSSSAGGA